MNLSPTPLRETLRAWRVAPPADPGFRPAVWARLETARRHADLTWLGYWRRHAALWSLTFLLALSGAALAGRTVGLRQAAVEHDSILHNYLAQIDARVMHR